ncbi:MAG: DUF1801 domain-containing protein [Deferribacteraceae bacterium]|jgi:uncharacterized protein YdhG (YjbR/CyaY superfamily)|nr:DUF1801 domain-containing protein [Deferribacteraceae bacterium]
MEIFNCVDDYITQFPHDVQQTLQTLRRVIKEEAPSVSEKISWGMPTFVLNGNRVYFAAYKRHIGLYPGADAIIAFNDRLTQYKTSKGTVQFPIDKPLPYDLIREIIIFCTKA